MPASSSAPSATIAALAAPLRPESSFVVLLLSESTVCAGGGPGSVAAGGRPWKGLGCCASAAAGATSANTVKRSATRASMTSAYFAQEALEHERVARREGLPVVVEVHHRVLPRGVLMHARRPLAQLGVGVVAPAPPRSVVEPHERKIGCARGRRQRAAAVVRPDTGDPVLAQ